MPEPAAANAAGSAEGAASRPPAAAGAGEQIAGVPTATRPCGQPAADPPLLRATTVAEIPGLLDLSAPSLQAAAAARQRGDLAGCLAAVLAHLRAAHPLPPPDPASLAPAERERAEKIVRRVFRYGPYPEAAYGADMDWEWDPRGDIEWVAWMYRFYWALPLAAAFRATRDERHAQAFVELTADWIAKHPLDQHERAHPVYTQWRGFAWLDIQTGIRATNLCQAVPVLLHAACFTPEFLGILLASLHDHQVKTERLPMGQVHNKAIFEQRGFIRIAHTFPEFAASRRWLALGAARAQESLLAQTTSDGVQREWSFGYHAGVLGDAVEIMAFLQAAGIEVQPAYRERVRRMFAYVDGIAGPDLGAPMFGDASRPPRPSPCRSTWQLYGLLQHGARHLHEPRLAARAELDETRLPPPTSAVFAEAGLYALRSDWTAGAIQLDLHCSPPAISSHDQPDNGTFELYAFGEWVMPDSGFYTYGHDPAGRAWHRRTCVHQTLTLNGADAATAGRHLLWCSQRPAVETLVVENDSYPGLRHRRTVWFVRQRFFVLLDEALGTAPGDLDLHFQFAPGELRLDPAGQRAWTARPGANVMVACAGDGPLALAAEEGWWGWAYGQREPRPACRFRHARPAPAGFVTVIVPYRQAEPQPRVELPRLAELPLGADRVELRLQVDGAHHALGRDLAEGSGWLGAPDAPAGAWRS